MTAEQPTPKGNEQLEKKEKPDASLESADRQRQEYQNLLDLKDKALGKLRTLGVDPEKNESVKPHLQKIEKVQREVFDLQLETGKDLANSLKGVMEKIRPDIYSLIDITLTFERVTLCSKPSLPPKQQARLLEAVNTYNRAEQQCLERIKQGGPESDRWKSAYNAGAVTMRGKLQNTTPETVDATIADINRAVQTWNQWETEVKQNASSETLASQRKQVTMKNGKVYRGVFEDSDLGYFKHWETAEDREKNPSGYTVIPKEDIKEAGPVRPAGMEVTDIPELQQVVMMDGNVRRGVFELGRGGQSYKYWKSAADKMKDPNGYVMIHTLDVKTAPGPIQPAGKEIERPPERQEAIMKNGRILRGIFVPSGEYFKYWKTAEDMKEKPNEYDVVRKELVKEEPGPITEREEEKPPEQPEPVPQQVVLQDGYIFRGVFADGGEYYKYWKSAEDMKARPTGYRIIMKGETRGSPGPITADTEAVPEKTEKSVERPEPPKQRPPAAEIPAQQREAAPEQPVELRQVILKNNGVVLQGVFERHGDTYRYWKTADLRKTEPFGYREIAREDLTGPVKPKSDKGLENASVEPSDAVRQLTTKSGETLHGVFELDRNAYRYWETAQDRKEDPQGYRSIHIDEIQKPPKPVVVAEREAAAEMARKQAEQPEPPQKEVAAEQPLERRQVTLKNLGVVLQGIFEQHGKTTFRYWKSEEERKAMPAGYRTFRKSELVNVPSPIQATGLENASVEPSDAVREITMKNGNTYRGIFEFERHYYKYWQSEEDREDHPAGYRVLAVDDVQDPPKPIRE